MFNLRNFVDKIKEKNCHDFKCLTHRLVNKVPLDLRHSQLIEVASNKKYLETEFDVAVAKQKHSLQTNDQKNKLRRRQNSSEKSFSNPHMLRPIRNNSSTIHESQGKELQIKRERLMIELKEVDLQLKSKHQEQFLSRIKRNKTQHQSDLPNYEKAVKLVEKMNIQRKQQMEKKRKDVLVLKHNVEESIRRFKEYEEQKSLEKRRRKQEIQKRIMDRKYKAFEREKINKVSDQIIKELNNYKLSLPEIFSRIKGSEIQGNPILLTGLQEEKTNTVDPRTQRSSHVLETLRKEDEQKVKEIERKIEYQKHVRNMHLQYGKKQRLIIKSKEKRISLSKKKL